MKTRGLYLFLLFLFVGMANVFAGAYYRPVSRVSTLEDGKMYMIFNTCMADGVSYVGFLYNNGTGLSKNANRKNSGHVYSSAHVWTVTTTATENVYYLKNVESGTYVGPAGVTTNKETRDVTIIPWQDAEASIKAGVGSLQENDTDVTANANISADDKVFVIGKASGVYPYWSGKPDSWILWESAQPFAFYEVEEVDDQLEILIAKYEDVVAAMSAYGLQRSIGLVKDASKWECNYPSNPVDGAGYPGLVDGNGDTHFHTGYTNHNQAPSGTDYYLQADLGYKVDDFYIYIQGRSNGNTKPSAFKIEGSNNKEEWSTINGAWTPTWSNNSCLSGKFETSGYRYLRFTNNGGNFFALGEFYIFPAVDAVEELRGKKSLPISDTFENLEETLDDMVLSANGLPVAGYKYYIYANTKYNGVYVPRYIYDNASTVSLTTNLLEKEDEFIWTCSTTSVGKFCFTNSQGKYLAYNSGDNKKFELVDSEYKFELKDDANTKSAGAFSLYSVAASRYVVTKTDGTSVNQYTNKEKADDDSWCSDYMFVPVYDDGVDIPLVTIDVNIPGVGRISYLGDRTDDFTFQYRDGADLPGEPVVDNPVYIFDGYYNKEGNTFAGYTLQGEEITADVTYEARYILSIFSTDFENGIPVQVYNSRNKDYVIRMNSADNYSGKDVNSGKNLFHENEIWYLVGDASSFKMYSRVAGKDLALKLAGTQSGSAASLAPVAEATELKLVLQSDGNYGIVPVANAAQSLNMHGGAGYNIKLYALTDGGSKWNFKRIDAEKPLVIYYSDPVGDGTKILPTNKRIATISMSLAGYQTTFNLNINNQDLNSVPEFMAGEYYLPVGSAIRFEITEFYHGWNISVSDKEGYFVGTPIELSELPDGGVTYVVNTSILNTGYQYVYYTPLGDGVPYRIPAIATTASGHVLAVSDKRPCKADIGNGEVDIMMRRSIVTGANWDGISWSDERTIADGEGGNENKFNVGFGDAAIVADRESSEVLIMAVAGRVVFTSGTADKHNHMARLRSHDNGNSWSAPENVTRLFMNMDEANMGTEYVKCDNPLFPDAYTMFFASGKILQSGYKKEGARYYRLYAALLVKSAGGNDNYVVYSDDFGDTWNILGGIAVDGGDEAKVEELPDGNIVISSRTGGARLFNIFTFTDKAAGAGSWATQVNSKNVGGLSFGSNSCNGEILRVGDYMFQSVPTGDSRTNVAIFRKSLKDAASYASPEAFAKDWELVREVSDKESAYSTMCLLPDGKTIGFLFEEEPGNYCIVYIPIPLSEVMPIEDLKAIGRPELTTDEEDPVWYKVKNVRGVIDNKGSYYVHYNSDSLKLGISAGAITTSSIFYFTEGDATAVEGALSVKIHNYEAAGKAMKNIDSWVQGGESWLVKYFEPTNYAGYRGWTISKSADADVNDAWNNFRNEYTTVDVWSPDDMGSTWEFERVTYFTDILHVNDSVQALRDELGAASLHALYGLDSNDVAELNAQLDALTTSGTYKDCMAALKLVADTRARFKGAANNKYVLFKTTGRDAEGHYLSCNSATLTGSAMKTLHTNLWQLQYVDNSSFKLYNFSGGSYAGIPADKNAASNIAITTTGEGIGTYRFVVSGGNVLIKSVERDGAYIHLISDKKNIRGYDSMSDVASHWNVEVTPDVIIDRNLYLLAATAAWNDPFKIQCYFGLVKDASNWISNYKSPEGSYEGLMDGQPMTFFHSDYDTNKDKTGHYLQADLGEGKTAAKLYFYMRARVQNALDRPTRVTFYGSNNNVDFTPVETVNTTLANTMYYISGEVGSANDTPYRYWRMTVEETNSGNNYFSLSELYFYESNENVKYSCDLFNEFYSTPLYGSGIIEVSKDMVLNEANGLITANASNNFAWEEQVPGSYRDTEYNSLVASRDNANVKIGVDITSADAQNALLAVKSAVTAFKKTKNRKMYHISNAFEGGYSDGLSIYNSEEEIEQDDHKTKFGVKESNPWSVYQYLALESPDLTSDNVSMAVELVNPMTGDQLYGSPKLNIYKIEGWNALYGKDAYNLRVFIDNEERYLNVTREYSKLVSVNAKSVINNDGTITNPSATWYIDEGLGSKYIQYLTPDYANALRDFGYAYASAKNMSGNCGPDVNQFTYEDRTDDGKDYTFDQLQEILNGDCGDFFNAGLETVLTHINLKSGDCYKSADVINAWAEAIMPHLDNFHMNIPSSGYMYRFLGGLNGGYISSDTVKHSDLNQKTFKLVENYEGANAAKTIFYLQENELSNGTKANHLLSYGTGLYMGITNADANGNYGGGNNNGFKSEDVNVDEWSYENIGVDVDKISRIVFVNSVLDPTKPKYSIRCSNAYLFANLSEGHIDRGAIPGETPGYDFNVEVVRELPVTITSAEYASFMAPVNLQIPEGMSAYIVGASLGEDAGNGLVRLEMVNLMGGKIPANTPVILRSHVGAKTFFMPILYNEEIDIYDMVDKRYDAPEDGKAGNRLKGVLEKRYIQPAANETHYILARPKNAEAEGGYDPVGLYKVKMKYDADNTTSGTPLVKYLGAHFKSYMAEENGSSSTSLRGFVFGAGGTTGIVEVENECNGKVIYDLSGRRLSEITEPGIYIVDGVKVLVR